jgi:hypothetical protein
MPSNVQGTCQVLFAYDIAFSIALDEAAKLIISHTLRETLKHKRRAPNYFQYQPAPIRFSQTIEQPLQAGGFDSGPEVELVLYDFGAVSVIYSLPFEAPLDRLLTLSCELYENMRYLEDSRTRVEKLMDAIKPAISKPGIPTFVEDYLVFSLPPSNAAPGTIETFLDRHMGEFAQILRAETRNLSPQEKKDALSHQISFSSDDVTIVDWNAAIVIDQEPEDILVVLEFANVELMEMRYLDRTLDDALGLAYDALSKRSWRRFPFGSNPPELNRVAQWQVDSAILFEGVNNSLKLLGDQYLARLYRLTAERFHLSEWDGSIIRKLETLDSIYGKIGDQVTSRRMEVLEWIIIVLIAVSIVLPFF